MTSEPGGPPTGWARWMVPITWIACPPIGLVVGVLFLYPDEWGVGRRLLAGLLLGVFTALILTANRLIGRSESI